MSTNKKEHYPGPHPQEDHEFNKNPEKYKMKIMDEMNRRDSLYFFCSLLFAGFFSVKAFS